MLVAYDKDGNRLYADSGIRYKECFCPVCQEPLKHRVGMHNRPHFAHMPESNCAYGKEKDNKSEWHIRMQNLFPRESMEVRFNDEVSGELRYIADIFLADSNTVIEFQHSPISPEDFAKRTKFHLTAGRRIVWIFDESVQEKEFGRLEKDNDIMLSRWPHSEYDYKWPHQRKVLNYGPIIKERINYSDFSVCVYCGDKENTVRRIVNQIAEYRYITLSVHAINLKMGMDCNEFFQPECFWLSQEEWKMRIAEHNRKEKETHKSDVCYTVVPGKRRVHNSHRL